MTYEEEETALEAFNTEMNALQSTELEKPVPMTFSGTIIYSNGSVEQIGLLAQDEKGLQIKVENARTSYRY